MLHRWIISSVQTFSIQMKKQNCEDWLVRITFMEILKNVGSIVIKMKISILQSTLWTSCLSTPAESTPESSPVKIPSVKSLPGEKRLDFLPPRQ